MPSDEFARFRLACHKPVQNVSGPESNCIWNEILDSLERLVKFQGHECYLDYRKEMADVVRPFHKLLKGPEGRAIICACSVPRLTRDASDCCLRRLSLHRESSTFPVYRRVERGGLSRRSFGKGERTFLFRLSISILQAGYCDL